MGGGGPHTGVVGLAVSYPLGPFTQGHFIVPFGGIRGLRQCRQVISPLARTGGEWEKLVRWESSQTPPREEQTIPKKVCIPRPTQVPRYGVHE